MSEVAKAVNDQQKAMVWALAAVRMAVRKAMLTATRPDFAQLQRLLAYVERCVENQHQANEERCLYRPFEARAPHLARTIARLRRDHSAMKGYRIRLAEVLGYWQKGDPNAPPQAAIVAQDYLHFCQRHARAEEALLPQLHEVASEAEWKEIGRSLGAIADPLARARSSRERLAALQAFG